MASIYCPDMTLRTNLLCTPDQSTFTTNRWVEQMSMLTNLIPDAVGYKTIEMKDSNFKNGAQCGIETNGSSTANVSLPDYASCHPLDSKNAQFATWESHDQAVGDFRAVYREASASLIRSLQHMPTDIDLTSESGWTSYLNTSSDSWAHSCSTMALDDPPANHSKNCLRLSGPSRHQRKPVAVNEDSSTASDASSGPEQPFLQSLEGHLWSGLEEIVFDMPTGSKRNYETVSGFSETRRFKRGKLPSCQLEIPASSSGLEDTASSPLQSPCHGEDNEDPERRDHAHCDDEAHLTLARVSPERRPEAVDHRFKILQALIPSVKELAQLNEEEMLKVTVDYVRSLELEVKMLGKTSSGKGMKLITVENSEREYPDQVWSTLQEKGLCLMPLSLVANALT